MRLLPLLASLLLPVLEIWLLILVGQAIGGWATLGLLLAGALAGAYVIRRQGKRVWRRLQEAARTGQMPEKEMGDASVVLAGGLLLVMPGLLTDVLGLACVLPFTRPLVRQAGSWLFARRLKRMAEQGAFPGAGVPFGVPPFGVRPSGDEPPYGGQARGPVINGQVIHEDDPGRPASSGPVPAPRPREP